MAYTTYTNTNSRLSASPHGETLPARLIAAVQRWHQRARDRAGLEHPHRQRVGISGPATAPSWPASPLATHGTSASIQA